MSRIFPAFHKSLQGLLADSNYIESAITIWDKDEAQRQAYIELMGKEPPEFPLGTEGYDQFTYSPRKRTAKKIFERAFTQ